MNKKLLRAVREPRAALRFARRKVAGFISSPEHERLQEMKETLNLIRQENLENSKKYLSAISQVSLKSFLETNSTIELPHYERPEISIILVLYNRAELTLNCLYAILKDKLPSFEVVIVDNASTDETKLLLRRIKGATIIENETNLHFLLASNQAGSRARGEYLLLLNNDAQILANSIASALETIKSAENIGGVGGKIILPDGTLQEAGSIVWQDGSCSGYGRGDDPFAPAYSFKRKVDYCSGAFFLTRRDLFLEGGGFDEDFKPAYYEETDYCIRLWKAGQQVIYDPKVVILHYEFASSNSQDAALDLQRKNRSVLVEKHRDWLQQQFPHAPENLLPARSAKDSGKRILLIEDEIPHTFLGAGFPRSNRILAELTRMGYFITFYPTCVFLPQHSPNQDWPTVYQDIPDEVEVMVNYNFGKLEQFLNERKNYYDLIFVCRPHNMQVVNSILAKPDNPIGETKIVYDAEALFCLRTIAEQRLKGEEPTPEDAQKLISEEMRIVEGSHCVVSVSENEGRRFTEYGYPRVHVLGNARAVTPTPNCFASRKDILFVGAVGGFPSPNADSLIWFAREIFPVIRQTLEQDVNFFIVGANPHEEIRQLADESIKFVGRVDDLFDLYNSARLFVAPTRFAAGIPLKVHEAVSYGLPVVTTTLLANQLGWKNEIELLEANDPESFALQCVRLYQDFELWNRLRANSLKRISEDCSLEAFAAKLRRIIEETTDDNYCNTG